MHISYTCLVKFVHHKELQRSVGTYFSYMTRSVNLNRNYNYRPQSRGSNVFGSIRPSVRLFVCTQNPAYLKPPLTYTLDIWEYLSLQAVDEGEVEDEEEHDQN